MYLLHVSINVLSLHLHHVFHYFISKRLGSLPSLLWVSNKLYIFYMQCMIFLQCSLLVILISTLPFSLSKVSLIVNLITSITFEKDQSLQENFCGDTTLFNYSDFKPIYSFIFCIYLCSSHIYKTRYMKDIQ